MTRLLVSREAEADLDAILQYLAENAGPTTAARYGERFAAAIERIVVFPGAGAPRPLLGPSTRIVIVYPYILFYDFPTDEPDTAALLRILHGKRAITEHLIKR
jgi:plasmid stabilization system protein ParE